MDVFLTRAGAFVDKASFLKLYGVKELERLRKRLFIRTVVDQYRNVIRTCNEMQTTKTHMIVPRAFAFEYATAGFWTVRNGIHRDDAIAAGLEMDPGRPELVQVVTKKARGKPAISTTLASKTPDPGPPECRLELSHNQTIIMRYLLDNIYTTERTRAGNACSILHLTAGQGKTFIGAAMIRESLARHIADGKPVSSYFTLIIVPNTTLLNQTTSVLKSVFPTMSCGEYYCKNKVLHNINVAIVDSATNTMRFSFKMHSRTGQPVPGADHAGYELVQKKTTQLDSINFYKMFNLIIFDEVHGYCSKEYRKLFQKAQSPWVLGLTATPNDRKDKFERYIFDQIGPLLPASEMPGYRHDEFNFVSFYHAIKYHGPPEHTLQHEFYNDTLNQLIDDEARNKIIIQLALDCYDINGEYTYVFSERRRHCEILQQMFIQALESRKNAPVPDDAGVVDDDIVDDADADADADDASVDSDAGFGVNINDIDINDIDINDLGIDNNAAGQEELAIDDPSDNVILMGGATANDEHAAEHSSKVIFATYLYLGVGKSIPKMTRAILATPRKSQMEQIMGRIFRKGGDGARHRYIYDIVDWKLSVKSQHYLRKKIAETAYRSTVLEPVKINAGESGTGIVGNC